MVDKSHKFGLRQSVNFGWVKRERERGSLKIKTVLSLKLFKKFSFQRWIKGHSTWVKSVCHDGHDMYENLPKILQVFSWLFCYSLFWCFCGTNKDTISPLQGIERMKRAREENRFYVATIWPSWEELVILWFGLDPSIPCYISSQTDANSLFVFS